MTIEAHLPDGTVMQFPDRTDPAVIQRTVKSVIAGPDRSIVGEIGTGAALGAMDVAALPRTISDLGAAGSAAVGLPKPGDSVLVQAVKAALQGPLQLVQGGVARFMPSFSDVRGFVENNITGPIKETGSLIEKGTRGAVAAAPFGIGGGAAGVGQAAVSGFGSGVGAELGRRGFEGTPLELPAQVAGAVVGGAGGSAAYSALAPRIQSLYRGIVGSTSLYDRTLGRLTDAGRQLLANAGANADDISDDLAREFARQAETAANPAEALTAAEARSLPVPVPMTRGNISQAPGAMRFEQQAAQGTYGQTPATIMAGSAQRQQEALRGNVQAIQERVAGSGPVIEPGQGGQTAQAALVAQRGAEKAGTEAAYTVARQGGAGVPTAAVNQGSFKLQSAVAAEHSVAGLPRTNQLLSEFDQLATQPAGSNVLVNSLFDWRKRASNAARGAGGSEEGVAIRKAIEAFDSWVTSTVDDALLQGDEAAVRAWQEAIGKYREFAGRFKGGDLVSKLTTAEPRSGQMQLKVAPEDAANFIFGASNTGWLTKANLSRDLTQIRNLLGADSPGWNALRQEAFLRLARAGEGETAQGVRQFSGVRFNKAWTDAQRNNQAVINVLFTPEERALISQFGRVAARVSQRTPYNTAADVANIVQNVGGQLGTRLIAALKGLGAGIGSLPIVESVAKGVNTGRAAAAAAGRPTPAGAPFGSLSPIGAVGVAPQAFGAR